MKVGWTKEWVEKCIGKEIVVCVLDSEKAVPSTKRGMFGQKLKNKESTVSVGEMDWPELEKTAMSDGRFVKMAKVKGITKKELPELFSICSSSPVRGDFKTDDPAKADKCQVLRELVDSQYGANDLYSGVGATISEEGDTGAREVMVSPEHTGLALTSDNHKFESLGELKQEEYNAFFTH